MAPAARCSCKIWSTRWRIQPSSCQTNEDTTSNYDRDGCPSDRLASPVMLMKAIARPAFLLIAVLTFYGCDDPPQNQNPPEDQVRQPARDSSSGGTPNLDYA